MLLDIFIVILVVSTVYRSRGSGFVRQFFGSGGFFGGLLVGRLLEPHTVQLAHSTNTRAAVTIATILGIGLIGLTLGEYTGLYIKRHLLKFRINRLDNSLGGVLTAISVLLSVWLLAAVASSLPSSGLETMVRNSRIVAGLNNILPSAPTIIGDLGRLIDPNGFPDVFIGNEPIPRGSVNLPALGDLATAVNADKDSVVRIEGQGCGGIVSGSGFVVGNDLIATNAHVVAGIKRPFVQDPNGTHRGKVVWFDAQLDFALIRVANLAGAPLTFNTATAAAGTPAAVLGYPGGGDFKAGAAAILDQFKASGHDIYGHGHTVRDIYEIKASIIPGNSGGPLIGKDGRVVGVVFAESTSYQNVGYTLTAQKVVSEIQQNAANQQAISPGQCAE